MVNRRVAIFGLATAAATISETAAWSSTNPADCVWPPPNWQKDGFPSRRWVKIVSVATGERFSDLYVHDGIYSIDAIKRFSWTVRDFRANEAKLLDPRLMDLLFVLHWKYCTDEIQVISGYRSGANNLNSERPILDEQHRNARALDIRLSGVDSEQIVKDLDTYIYGGVSSFPALNFLHVDMGPLRKSSTERLNSQASQGPERVNLEKQNGVYTVPVLLNRTINLNFVLDSGASEVLLSPKTAKQLVETSTITEADFIGHAIYELADGSKLRSPRFYLRELVVGNQVVRNVIASIGPERSSLLLGQSFLSNFGSWTLDNEHHVLVLSPKSQKAG